MKTPEEQTALAERIEFPVRKGAHMTEYVILAVLLLGILAGEYMEGCIVIWSVILAALYASTDEFHQLFVPGRSGQFRDVLIVDTGNDTIWKKHFTLCFFWGNMARQERSGQNGFYDWKCRCKAASQGFTSTASKYSEPEIAGGTK